MNKSQTAVRAVVRGRVQGVGFRDAALSRARALGALGWVRNGEDGTVLAHVEGSPEAVDGVVAFLAEGPPVARVEGVETEAVKVEGHEQFAVRGVSAGVFVVQEQWATAQHFDLRLEVDGAMRSWAVPKEPSMDPAVKRLAIEVEDHCLAHNEFEGELDGGRVEIWDRGSYEQGGRVPWPEALERGHAVFALQRTGGSTKPQWLLIKRKDELAQPGPD